MVHSGELPGGFTVLPTGGPTPSPEPGRVRLAAVQMDCRLGDAPGNLGRCLEAIRLGAGLGAGLVVFPECALTGYCLDRPEDVRAAAIEGDGEILRELTRATADPPLAVAVGYLERTRTGVANAVTLLEGGSRVGHYRKTHLPHLGADRFTEPGEAPFRVMDAAGLRVGLLICYDASFPEASRLLALAGAEVLLLPTNWPEEAEAKAAWLPNTRAYENVVYFAAVNRVGSEGGFRFHGRSRICDPAGNTLVEGPLDDEAILLADLDPRLARSKRIVRRDGYWVDRIGQRRSDLYRLSGPPDSGNPQVGEGGDNP